MARRVAALKPQLNRIRAWAHEGSTDAWIAHQLDTTAEVVRAFRQEHGIERGGPAPLAPITPDSVVEAMLAEEAAALEAGPEPEEAEPVAAPEPAAPAPRRRTRRKAAEPDSVEGPEPPVAEVPVAVGDASAEPEAEPAKPARRRRSSRAAAAEAASEAPVEESAAEAPPAEEAEAPGEAEPADGDDADAPAAPARRKRGRRRGRGRGGSRALEARLLPGSVLLLDPAVVADATFQEHWQNAGSLRVEVSSDAIVLRRASPDGDTERVRPD
jgi:hypothetical protein